MFFVFFSKKKGLVKGDVTYCNIVKGHVTPVLFTPNLGWGACAEEQAVACSCNKFRWWRIRL